MPVDKNRIGVNFLKRCSGFAIKQHENGLPQRSQLIPCATLRWRGHYFAEPGPVLDGPCVLVDRSLKIGNSPVAEAGFDLPARSSYDAAQRIVFGAKEGAISGD